jgi:hypothetical protein
MQLKAVKAFGAAEGGAGFGDRRLKILLAAGLDVDLCDSVTMLASPRELALLPCPARSWKEPQLIAAIPRLHRRAFHRAVGAKHTAIARPRLQPYAAPLAVIEELASVGRHRLGRLVGAMRTGDGRFKLHRRDDIATQRG